jgi:hypothetical protein
MLDPKLRAVAITELAELAGVISGPLMLWSNESGRDCDKITEQRLRR